MFRAEHEAALRLQIRSLAAMCGVKEDAPEVLKILGDTMKEQSRLLEEIRIQIHNQLVGGPKALEEARQAGFLEGHAIATRQATALRPNLRDGILLP